MTFSGIIKRKGSTYCKCCNFRVRTKPRGSLDKEKYYDQVSKKPNEFSIKQNELYVESELSENPQEEIKQEKKSTPIYDKISGKSYPELREFIEKEIRPQANYQYVLLKYLLSHVHAHKGEIAETLAFYNNKDFTNIYEVKKFLTVPVFDVLEKTGFITKSFQPLVPGDSKINVIKYHLDVNLNEYQSMYLDSVLEEKIQKYNNKYNISTFDSVREFDDIDWYENKSLLEVKFLEDKKTNEKRRSRQRRFYNLNKLMKEESSSVLIQKECPQCQYIITLKQNVKEVDNHIDESKKFRNDTKKDNQEIEPEQMLVFDSQHNGINIKYFEMKNAEFISKGQNLTNDELVSKFKVGNMGGIRYSSKNNLIVLCDTESGHYDNVINKESNIIYYSGEGQIGDQTMSRGNQQIANSKDSSIFYFIEVPQQPGQRKRGALDNIYRYVGKVRYIKHVIQTENDINGSPRQVIKFLLGIEK